ANNAAAQTSFIPLLTLGIGVLVLRERPHIAAALGAALSLTGIAVLIGEGDPRRLLDVGVTQGDGLMLIAAAAYALYGVLLRKWAMPVSAWSSLYVQIVFGVLFQFPGFLLAPSSPLNSANLPMVLYAAVFPSLFAPYLWMRGIHHLGPQRASVFLNLMPFATAAIAATVLGEMLHAYHVIGGLMTMGGVMLAQRRT
nr:DMT family transporter [Pseudomonas sp.]